MICRDVACNVSKQENRVVTLFDGRSCLARKSRLRLDGLKPILRPPSGINTGFWFLRRCRQRLYVFLFSSHHRAEKSHQAAVLLALCPPPAFSHLSPQGGEGIFCAKRYPCWGNGKKRGGLPPPRSCITAVLPPAVPTLARCHPATWCAAGRRSIVPPASSG